MWNVIEVIRESDETLNDGAGRVVQKKNLDEFIASQDRFKGCEVTEKHYTQSTTYTDKDARKDYLDMLAYAKKETVFAFADSSRFSRNVGPSVAFLEKLRYEIGCKYIIVDNRVFDLENETDYSDLIKMQADEHKTSRAWFKKSKDGKLEWKLKGYFSGGGIAYGLKGVKVKVGKKERTIHVKDGEEKPKVIVLICGLYLQKKSTCDIALELNARGIKAPLGGKWDSDAVLRILKRERYVGVQAEDGTWLSPQIIDRVTFEEVQKMIVKNANRGQREKAKIIFPLRNQCYCGCGQTVRFHTFHKGRLKVNKIFYCANHFLKKTKKGKVPRCPLYVNAEEVVDFVWSKIVPMFTEPKRLRQVISEYVDSCFANKVESELGIAEKQKEIAKINGCCNRIKYQFEKGHLSESEYNEKYRGYQLQRFKVDEEIKALHDKITIDRKINSRIIEVEKLLPKFQKEFSNPTVETKAWWLEQLVEKVVLTYVNGKYEVTIFGSVDEFFDGYLEHLKNKNFEVKIPSQRVHHNLRV